MNSNDVRSILPLTTIGGLTDAAQRLFVILYNLERARTEMAKARLRAVLRELDLFAPEPNHEDYVPGEGEQRQ